MADPKAFKIEVDRDRRIATIQGVRYAFDLFDQLGFGLIGARFEIVGRRDGVVELRTLPATQTNEV
jgi:hypothetical protein